MEQDHIQSPSFIDPTKPAQPNPLNWSYPHYFDATPAFEESQYYDRQQQSSPSFSQMISKPLQSIGRRLNSRHVSTHSRPTSQSEHNNRTWTRSASSDANPTPSTTARSPSSSTPTPAAHGNATAAVQRHQPTRPEPASFVYITVLISSLRSFYSDKSTSRRIAQHCTACTYILVSRYPVPRVHILIDLYYIFYYHFTRDFRMDY